MSIFDGPRLDMRGQKSAVDFSNRETWRGATPASRIIGRHLDLVPGLDRAATFQPPERTFGLKPKPPQKPCGAEMLEGGEIQKLTNLAARINERLADERG